MKNTPTILAVDDTELNVDMLVGILKKYDVIPVLNGEDALELASREDVDLILLDIIMPEPDGFEVCRRLKENEKTRHIPIIFITAKTGETDIQQGFELGGVDYVTKPFNPSELLSRVHTHLELRRYQMALEERVNEEMERSRIRERQLNQQSKQAALGELLMHIAHQWKQPLSELASINMLNLGRLGAQQTLSSEELLEDFKRCDQIIKFMSSTVESFQNFYKPTREKRFFDVHDTLMQAAYIIGATLSYHKIGLTVQKIHTPKAYGHENEYAQVMLNLLSNAKEILVMRNTPDPRITITVEMLGERSVVQVCDNGGGIDEEIMETLFEPFAPSRQGSGIGLHMSRAIMEKNGGTLEARNTPQGACFTLIL